MASSTIVTATQLVRCPSQWLCLPVGPLPRGDSAE